ncbi:MAG: hypothetical protein AAFX76_00755 [Planctomycetota bacterium]
MHPHRLPQPAARPAFTLNEILIALGILGLGIVAVASLFPTAAFLQKQAVNETLRQNHTRSSDAVLEGVGISNAILLNFAALIETDPGTYDAFTIRQGDNVVDPELDVFALAEIDLTTTDATGINPSATATTPISEGGLGGQPDMTLNAGLDLSDSYLYGPSNAFPNGRFPIAARSFPSSTPATTANNYIDREVFVVPLVRQGIEASTIFPDWSVFAFVLQPPSQLRNANTYATGNYTAINSAFNSYICANPADADYVPKVFRVPVAWNANDPNVIDPPFSLDGFLKAGELILGDNGKIYRIAQFNPAGDEILVESQTIFEPINERDLTAIWIAPAPGGADQDSPLGDLRLLSNQVVRAEDL